jgi:putative transposase
MSRLIPGTPILWRDQKWILLDIPALDRVLVRNPESGQTELVSPAEIKLNQPTNGKCC